MALAVGLAAFILAGVLIGLLLTGIAEANDIPLNDSAPAWLQDYLPAALLVITSVILLKLVIRRLGANKRDDLPFDSTWRDFPKGIVFAGVLMSAIVGVAALFGGYRIDGVGRKRFLLVHLHRCRFSRRPSSKKSCFAGSIFRFLEEFAGSWVALLLSALLFGLVHWSNPNGTLFASLGDCDRSRDPARRCLYAHAAILWLAIGLHWGWNVVQAYIWRLCLFLASMWMACWTRGP